MGCWVDGRIEGMEGEEVPDTDTLARHKLRDCFFLFVMYVCFVDDLEEMGNRPVARL